MEPSWSRSTGGIVMKWEYYIQTFKRRLGHSQRISSSHHSMDFNFFINSFISQQFYYKLIHTVHPVQCIQKHIYFFTIIEGFFFVFFHILNAITQATKALGFTCLLKLFNTYFHLCLAIFLQAMLLWINF